RRTGGLAVQCQCGCAFAHFRQGQAGGGRGRGQIAQGGDVVEPSHGQVGGYAQPQIPQGGHGPGGHDVVDREQARGVGTHGHEAASGFITTVTGEVTVHHVVVGQVQACGGQGGVKTVQTFAGGAQVGGSGQDRKFPVPLCDQAAGQVACGAVAVGVDGVCEKPFLRPAATVTNWPGSH